MAKSRVAIGKLETPNVTAAAAAPFANAPSSEPAPLGSGKSLTVKLEAADYWALRDYCTRRERAIGKRVTHQEVMVAALRALLGQRAAA